MYLIHHTSINNLLDILKDGKLKAAYLTGNLDQGEGQYKPEKQKHVFFNCISKEDFNEYKIDGHENNVCLFFESSLLYNRVFFTSDRHGPFPEKTSKKHDRYTNKKTIDKILKKLYDYSLGIVKKHKHKYKNDFTAFQQIAIRNGFIIDDSNLVAIKFKKRPNDSSQIIRYIKKNYQKIYLETQQS